MTQEKIVALLRDFRARRAKYIIGCPTSGLFENLPADLTHEAEAAAILALHQRPESEQSVTADDRVKRIGIAADALATAELRDSAANYDEMAEAVVDALDAHTALHRDAPGCHGLDNERQVFFYEQDFYVLSNFSAFTLEWKGLRFDTSEAAYHWEKFNDTGHGLLDIRMEIRKAASAHEAFKIAERHRDRQREDWGDIRIEIMRDILRAKARQHEYVRRKLLATGDRELIENSWRDDFWGWGPNRDGENMLGKLWMEVRAEMRQPVIADQREAKP